MPIKGSNTRVRSHGCLYAFCLLMREILPMIVPDGDNSSPNVLLRTGGTKSKSKFIVTVRLRWR